MATALKFFFFQVPISKYNHMLAYDVIYDSPIVWYVNVMTYCGYIQHHTNKLYKL